ncbi:MAG: hypothetical protein JNK29_04910 [Anaerolineales bacterium]|nr:hypothetical protein [Anaerolineales bacterium]
MTRLNVNDQVVHSAHGIGRVVALVTRGFGAEARRYYEISIERNTIWVPMDSDLPSELRLLTANSDLARYRAILQGRPASLTADHRQRRSDVAALLKTSSFQTLCELVRDLTARSWARPLTQMDAAALRRARERLCREWAAVDKVELPAATQEIDGLLGLAQQGHANAA